MNGKFGCFVFLLLLAGLGVGGYLYMDQIMDRVLEFTEPKVTKDVERRIFETTEFVRSLENLELAERWTRETVKETDTVRVQLPFLEQELVSNASYEVRFSVIYTYVVSARRDDWRFKLLGDVLYVQAPQIECRPPAIDTGSIEARFDEGLLVLEEEKRLEEIKRSLTAIANERAVDSAILNWCGKNAGPPYRNISSTGSSKTVLKLALSISVLRMKSLFPFSG